MKDFFSSKKNIVTVSVVLAGAGLLAWSIISLFRAAEYQEAMLNDNDYSYNIPEEKIEEANDGALNNLNLPGKK